MAKARPGQDRSGPRKRQPRIPERGEKGRWIREALAADPRADPKDLAAQLQRRADSEGVSLTFKPIDLASARQRLQPAPEPEVPTGGNIGPAATASARERPAEAPAPLSYGEAVRLLQQALAVLGKQEAKRLLEEQPD